MERLKEIFWDTLKLFRDLELLPHLLLVGSWAEYIYEVGYFKDYYSNLKTRDLDFLIKNINRPARPINIVDALDRFGYKVDYDYLTGVNKFYKEGLLEIEFLVREVGRGQTEPYIVKSLGIKVEGLRHMDLLVENSMHVEIPQHGVTVQVPSPPSYVLHKMIISHDRAGSKRIKDLQAIDNLLNHMKQYPAEMYSLGRLFETGLTKKQRARVMDFCSEHKIYLKELGYEICSNIQSPKKNKSLDRER